MIVRMRLAAVKVGPQVYWPLRLGNYGRRESNVRASLWPGAERARRRGSVLVPGLGTAHEQGTSTYFQRSTGEGGSVA